MANTAVHWRKGNSNLGRQLWYGNRAIRMLFSIPYTSYPNEEERPNIFLPKITPLTKISHVPMLLAPSILLFCSMVVRVRRRIGARAPWPHLDHLTVIILAAVWTPSWNAGVALEHTPVATVLPDTNAGQLGRLNLQQLLCIWKRSTQRGGRFSTPRCSYAWQHLSRQACKQGGIWRHWVLNSINVDSHALLESVASIPTSPHIFKTPLHINIIHRNRLRILHHDSTKSSPSLFVSSGAGSRTLWGTSILPTRPQRLRFRVRHSRKLPGEGIWWRRTSPCRKARSTATCLNRRKGNPQIPCEHSPPFYNDFFSFSWRLVAYSNFPSLNSLKGSL